MYSYELAAELRSRSDVVIDLPECTVYPALRRLERAGWISGRWVDISDAPRRRYHTLTPRGAKAMADGRDQWRRIAAAADAVLGG